MAGRRGELVSKSLRGSSRVVKWDEAVKRAKLAPISGAAPLVGLTSHICIGTCFVWDIVCGCKYRYLLLDSSCLMLTVIYFHRILLSE